MGFWSNKKPKPENFASEEDIKRIRKDLERIEKSIEPFQQKQSTNKRVIKALGKGFGDIAESLSHPESKRRMRISQMPGRKTPIATYNTTNPISGKNAGIKRHRISNAPKVED